MPKHYQNEIAYVLKIVSYMGKTRKNVYLPMIIQLLAKKNVHNFYNSPTNENFCIPRKFHKNRKKVKISEIMYVMSSYRDKFWRLQMEV